MEDAARHGTEGIFLEQALWTPHPPHISQKWGRGGGVQKSVTKNIQRRWLDNCGKPSMSSVGHLWILLVTPDATAGGRTLHSLFWNLYYLAEIVCEL